MAIPRTVSVDHQRKYCLFNYFYDLDIQCIPQTRMHGIIIRVNGTLWMFGLANVPWYNQISMELYVVCMVQITS